MALKNTDLFAVYRESESTAYHLKASNLQFKLPDGTDAGEILVWNGATWVPGDNIDSLQSQLPDGSNTQQMLVWSGTAWVPGDSIDGGEYAV